MSEQERPFDIEVEWKDPTKTNQICKIKMRKQRWVYDQSLQLKLQDAKGQPNIKELWIARITDTVQGITTESLKTIDQFTMNIYIAKWLQYNDVNEASFLETSQSTN